MKKVGLVLVLVMFCLPVSDARPWYRDWKVWTVVGMSIGASAAATHNAHECRLRTDVAFCSGGYGPFAAREGLRFGLAAGLATHAVWGRHQGFKEWPVFALGFAGFNTVVAVKQARVPERPITLR